MHVPHYRPSDEHVLDGDLVSATYNRNNYKVRVFIFLQDGDIVEFDIEKLVNRFKYPLYGKVIFEFHRHFLIDQCLEEGVEYCC